MPQSWLSGERVPPDCVRCGGTLRILRRAQIDQAQESSASSPARTTQEFYVVRCDDCRNQFQWTASDPYRVERV